MIPFYKRLEKIEGDHDDQHRLLFRFAFCILPDITSVAPTLNTLQPGFGQWYVSGTTRRLYYNLNGVLIYSTFTNA